MFTECEPAGEKLYTFTIITTSSSSALGWLHGESCFVLINYVFCLSTVMSLDTVIDYVTCSTFILCGRSLLVFLPAH